MPVLEGIAFRNTGIAVSGRPTRREDTRRT